MAAAALRPLLRLPLPPLPQPPLLRPPQQLVADLTTVIERNAAVFGGALPYVGVMLLVLLLVALFPALSLALT